MRKSTLFLIILQLFFIPAKSWLQINNDVHKQQKFRYITIDNGLSHNRVNSICEDKYGYIWIATIYGINRYDGMRIRQYNHVLGDSLSLPSDVIYKVFNDSRGTLWIGTDDGLCYYNESGDNFSPFWFRNYRPGIMIYLISLKTKTDTFGLPPSVGYIYSCPKETALFVSTIKVMTGNGLCLPTRYSVSRLTTGIIYGYLC